ncbi:MAG TPA: CPBP family intramembrane glutamic endopeptidase [Acidimicrobiales bacterium]|nr:CPBP family intramembrane glutamic endopeptidase [Acidimicrobiales bacterium]
MTEAPAAPSADAPTRPRTWGLGDVALGFAIGLLGAQLALGAILGATGRTADQVDELPLSLVALAQVGLWLGLFGGPWLATRLKGNGLAVDLGLRARLGDLWRGGLVGAGLQLVALPLLYWPLLHLLDKTSSDLEGPAREMTDRADGALGVVLLVLIVGVGAPIVEEIFYRGLFQRALLKRGLSPAVAIGISAVVFGASHFQLLQLPALVLFGVAAGILAHRSGRLGPAIAAHVAFNMVTVIALLIAG